MSRGRLSALARWGVAIALVGGGVTSGVRAQPEDLTPVRYALVIGINTYLAELEGVPELDFAVPDARQMAELLEDQGWEVATAIDDEATRRRIVRELVRMARRARQQDTVLIYFAGHGVQDLTAGEHTYWLTHTASIAELAVDGIRLSHLMEYLRDIPADRKVLILDHCHSGDVESVVSGTGTSRAGEGDVRLTRHAFPEASFERTVEEQIGSGLVVLGAARAEAYEFPELGHGIFTYSLLQTLRDPAADANGDGKLSVSEIIGKTKILLAQLTADRQIVQSPIEIVRGTNLLSLGLLDVQGPALAELRSLLLELEFQAGLDPKVRNACFVALHDWEQASALGAEPSATDRQIVEELQTLFELGASLPGEVKAEILVSKLCLLRPETTAANWGEICP